MSLNKLVGTFKTSQSVVARAVAPTSSKRVSANVRPVVKVPNKVVAKTAARPAVRLAAVKPAAAESKDDWEEF